MSNTTSLINAHYWVCDPCLCKAWNSQGRVHPVPSRVAPLSQQLCVCCSFPGGALKRTWEGEWCHVSCMLLSNRLTVLNYTHMEPIIATPTTPADAELLSFSSLPHSLFIHVPLPRECDLDVLHLPLRGRIDGEMLRGGLPALHAWTLSAPLPSPRRAGRRPGPQWIWTDRRNRRNRRNRGIGETGRAGQQNELHFHVSRRGRVGFPRLIECRQRIVRYYCPLHGISKDSAESSGCGVGGSGVFTLEYPNNEVYKGEVHNDKREGYGEYYFSNGVV